MIKRILLLGLLLSGSAGAQVITERPQVAPAPTWLKTFGNYGNWWNALSEDGKKCFLNGYLGAMRRTHFVLASECYETKNSLKPGPSLGEQLKAVDRQCGLVTEFDFEGSAPLRPGLDEFYKDSLNMRISVDDALAYVRDKIMGRNPDGRLNALRAIVNKDERKD